MRPSCFLVLSAIALLGTSASTYGHCAPSQPIEQALEEADAVFEGQVVNTWPRRIELHGIATIGQTQTLRVFRAWKGDVGPETRVIDLGFTHSNRFRRGETYLVFAVLDPEAGGLVWMPCAPSHNTHHWPRADLRTLGEGRSLSSPNFEYRAESIAHLAARRATIAFLVAREVPVVVWRSLSDTPQGVVTRAVLQLVGIVLLVIVGRLAWKRCWRLALLTAAIPPVISLAILFAWAYHNAMTNHWFRHLVE